MLDLPPDIAELMREPDTLEYEGKTYKFRELTIEQRGKYSQWLKDKALASVEFASRSAPEHVGDRLYKTYLQEVSALEYDYGGTVYLSSMGSFLGKAKALQLALSDDHPEMTEELAEKILKAKHNEIGESLAKKVNSPTFRDWVAKMASTGPTSSPPSPASTRSRSKKSKGSRRRK